MKVLAQTPTKTGKTQSAHRCMRCLAHGNYRVGHRSEGNCPWKFCSCLCEPKAHDGCQHSCVPQKTVAAVGAPAADLSSPGDPPADAAIGAAAEDLSPPGFLPAAEGERKRPMRCGRCSAHGDVVYGHTARSPKCPLADCRCTCRPVAHDHCTHKCVGSNSVVIASVEVTAGQVDGPIILTQSVAATTPA